MKKYTYLKEKKIDMKKNSTYFVFNHTLGQSQTLLNELETSRNQAAFKA